MDGGPEFLDDDLLDVHHLLTVVRLHLPVLDFLETDSVDLSDLGLHGLQRCTGLQVLEGGVLVDGHLQLVVVFIT